MKTHICYLSFFIFVFSCFHASSVQCAENITEATQHSLYLNCSASERLTSQSFSELKKTCKVIIDNGWLEWAENIKDITFHYDAEFDKIIAESIDEAEDSILVKCDVASDNCSSIRILTPKQKNIEIPLYKKTIHSSKRDIFFSALLKNAPNALIYRRFALSPDFQRRFGYDKGLFQLFLQHDSLDYIELSKNRIGLIREFAYSTPNKPVSQEEIYNFVKNSLNSKTIQTTEQFSKNFAILDNWADETLISPQLAIYSNSLTTLSAGYLLMSADPKGGLYIVFEDKTCLYIDSDNVIHAFLGPLNGGRPVLIYNSKTNQYWHRLPFSADSDELNVDYMSLLEQHPKYEEISKYIDHSKKGFAISDSFKHLYLSLKKLLNNFNDEDLYRTLIARERGSEEREIYKKEFLFSGVYNSLIDHTTFSFFLDSCTQSLCSANAGRILFLNAFNKSERKLRYNNFSAYDKFYLSSPFEAWLSKDLTCTTGTQISLVFDLYESILSNAKYYCKQGYEKSFNGTVFHFWCWTESGEFILENLQKLPAPQRATTRASIFSSLDKTPLLCFSTQNKSIDVVECENIDYNKLYSAPLGQLIQPQEFFYNH